MVRCLCSTSHDHRRRTSTNNNRRRILPSLNPKRTDTDTGTITTISLGRHRLITSTLLARRLLRINSNTQHNNRRTSLLAPILRTLPSPRTLLSLRTVHRSRRR